MEYISVPVEGEQGKTIIVTTATELDGVRDAGKHKFRVVVSLDYEALADGMPTDEYAEILEKVTDAFEKTLKKDNAVVLAEMATGEGRRDWVFHTTSLYIFRNVFNRALADLPTYPFLIEAWEDPTWQD